MDTSDLPHVNLFVQQRGQSFVLRAIWFVMFGWWLSGIAIVIAYFCFLFVVTIPIGIALIHQVPRLQTLRPRTVEYQSRVVGGKVLIREGTLTQRPLLIRALWFIFIGWWFTAFWLAAAWMISLPIVTIPISVMMIDRAPGMLTLQKF